MVHKILLDIITKLRCSLYRQFLFSSSAMCCVKCGWFIFAILFLTTAILMGIDNQKEKFYIFDQNELQEIAVAAINSTSNTQDMFKYIADELAERYPGHIEKEQECMWCDLGRICMGTRLTLSQGYLTMLVVLWDLCGYCIPLLQNMLLFLEPLLEQRVIPVDSMLMITLPS